MIGLLEADKVNIVALRREEYGVLQLSSPARDQSSRLLFCCRDATSHITAASKMKAKVRIRKGIAVNINSYNMHILLAVC
jgi:hypothetical protein